MFYYYKLHLHAKFHLYKYFAAFVVVIFKQLL